MTRSRRESAGRAWLMGVSLRPGRRERAAGRAGRGRVPGGLGAGGQLLPVATARPTRRLRAAGESVPAGIGP